jgi:hypothetical protein
MLASASGDTPSSAEIASDLEVYASRYLAQATPGEQKEYREAEQDEKINILWLWMRTKVLGLPPS